MRTTTKIRVLIADDSPTALRSICDYLEFAGTFEIVGTASDGQNAVQLAALYKPDLVLLDLSMPRVNGLEAAEHIRLSSPDMRIIIFSELQRPFPRRRMSSARRSQLRSQESYAGGALDGDSAPISSGWPSRV